MVVALSTVAGFGLSSFFGLLFGPVHNVLPFVLLGCTASLFVSEVAGSIVLFG